MRWLMLAVWGALCLGAKDARRAMLLRAAYTLGVVVSMLCQLRLLWLDGQLSLRTGLPLHLCGLMGVLSPWLVWRAPAWLLELSFFLGAPCALATLFFPAVIASSQPLLMSAAFYRLHVLVALAPALALLRDAPPPADPRRAFVLGNGYLLGVALFNRAFQTNYLFLRRPPMGTPLAILFASGAEGYVLSLELLCMLMMFALSRASRVYLRKYESIYPL